MATEKSPAGSGVVAREKRQRSMHLISTLVAVWFLFLFVCTPAAGGGANGARGGPSRRRLYDSTISRTSLGVALLIV